MSMFDNEIAAVNAMRRNERRFNSPAADAIAKSGDAIESAFSVPVSRLFKIPKMLSGLGVATLEENLEYLGDATEVAVSRIEKKLEANEKKVAELSRGIESQEFKDAIASAVLQTQRTTQKEKLKRIALILANGLAENDLRPEIMDDMTRAAVELSSWDVQVLRGQGGSNSTVNFHGEKRSNETHCSTTDPDAMLAPKSRGSAAVLAYRGHLLTENRNGLVIATRPTEAYGRAERDAALLMAEKIPGDHRVTLGADKGYDAREFIDELRQMNITPHIAQNDTRRRSAIDQRTTRHEGYRMSQRQRKRIEEVFGWMKTVGLLRKLRHRGQERVGWMFTFTAAAYNLVRMRNLLGSTPQPQCA